MPAEADGTVLIRRIVAVCLAAIGQGIRLRPSGASSHRKRRKTFIRQQASKLSEVEKSVLERACVVKGLLRPQQEVHCGARCSIMTPLGAPVEPEV